MKTILPLFVSALSERMTTTPRELLATIENFQTNSQTGLVEINPNKQNQFALLFTRGQLVNLYICNHLVERISKDDWIAVIKKQRGDVELHSLVLTPQAIRLVKIFIEQLGNDPTSQLKSKNLEHAINTWKGLTEPSLVHVHWKSADALTLLPGSNNPPRHTLFVASEQILHSAGGMMALYGWKEKECTVSLYSSDVRTPAWEEYLLHTGFVWMVGHMLSRFEELTGRLLLNTITRDVNFSASTHGWQISITPNSVTDQMVFPSPMEAAKVYRWLFDAMVNRVESIVGIDLIKILIRESLMRMQLANRDIFQKYITLIDESAPVQSKNE